MNFTEFGFWPRLILCLFIIFAGRCVLYVFGKRQFHTFDKFALALTSLYLLASVDVITSSVFCSLCIITFFGAYLLSSVPQNKRRWVLLGLIPVVFFPLAYFKYKSFFLEEILGWEKVTFDSLAIPAGISFYSFQMVALLIDASRLPAYRPKIVDLLNFMSFFPQVVAGPIERKSHLMPQIKRFRFRITRRQLESGIPWIVLGFFYKICLADNLSPYIQRDSMDSAWPILWNTFLFGLKIYFDFCGYSLIALGLAKVIGIKLTLNFRSPYWSISIREFWRRWHVTLSYWFRDYVYIPLGGSRVPFWSVNLLVVFAISGVWHGAGWNFVLWGTMHGVYCVIGHAVGDRLPIPAIMRWILTISLVFIAWLPFYETRSDILWEKLMILLNPESYKLVSAYQWIRSFETGKLLTMTAAVALCIMALVFEKLSLNSRRRHYAYARNPYSVGCLVAATVILGAAEGESFVYFTF